MYNKLEIVLQRFLNPTRGMFSSVVWPEANCFLRYEKAVEPVLIKYYSFDWDTKENNLARDKEEGAGCRWQEQDERRVLFMWQWWASVDPSWLHVGKELVAQSCLTLCDLMDCSPPGSSVHRIFQAGIQEWVAISSSRGSSPPRDWTQVSYIAGIIHTVWATRKTSMWGINSLKYGRGCTTAINSQLRCHKHHLHVQHIREKISQASVGSPTYYPQEENKRTGSWYHFYLFLFCAWYPVIALTLNIFF